MFSVLAFGLKIVLACFYLGTGLRDDSKLKLFCAGVLFLAAIITGVNIIQRLPVG